MPEYINLIVIDHEVNSKAEQAFEFVIEVGIDEILQDF